MFESFLIYQRLVAREFRKMQKRYGLVFINGNRSIEEIGTELQKKIDDFVNFRSLDDINELGLIGRMTLTRRKQELNQT
jgi:hypothetical protein